MPLEFGCIFTRGRHRRKAWLLKGPLFGPASRGQDCLSSGWVGTKHPLGGKSQGELVPERLPM